MYICSIVVIIIGIDILVRRWIVVEEADGNGDPINSFFVCVYVMLMLTILIKFLFSLFSDQRLKQKASNMYIQNNYRTYVSEEYIYVHVTLIHI